MLSGTVVKGTVEGSCGNVDTLCVYPQPRVCRVPGLHATLYALARVAAASTLPAPPRTMLGASPLDETRSIYVHTGVNKVVAYFVTILPPFCVQESCSHLCLLYVLSVESLYGSYKFLVDIRGSGRIIRQRQHRATSCLARTAQRHVKATFWVHPAWSVAFFVAGAALSACEPHPRRSNPCAGVIGSCSV
jgi:hypothetical protein